MTKIKKYIKIIFGTENNILSKFSLSCFFTGIIFFLFALMFQSDDTQQLYMTFTCISAILFAIWLIIIENKPSILEFVKELLRLVVFFVILIFSLDFCINQSLKFNGFKLIWYSILSCIGIFICLFYLISKFLDIFKSIKNIIVYSKQKLFNSIQPTTSKIKSLIENITAFLVSIASLGVSIKTIIEPLINLLK